MSDAPTEKPPTLSKAQWDYLVAGGPATHPLADPINDFAASLDDTFLSQHTVDQIVMDFARHLFGREL